MTNSQEIVVFIISFNVETIIIEALNTGESLMIIELN